MSSDESESESVNESSSLVLSLVELQLQAVPTPRPNSPLTVGKLMRAVRLAGLEAAAKLAAKHKLALHRVVDTTTASQILIVDDEQLNCRLLGAEAAGRGGSQYCDCCKWACGREHGRGFAHLTGHHRCRKGRGHPVYALQPHLLGSPNASQGRRGGGSRAQAVARWLLNVIARACVQAGLRRGHVCEYRNTAEWLAVGVDEMLPKPFTAVDIRKLLLAMHQSKSASAESATSGRKARPRAATNTFHESESSGLPRATTPPTLPVP
jgi:hypothetical protein